MLELDTCFLSTAELEAGMKVQLPRTQQWVEVMEVTKEGLADYSRWLAVSTCHQGSPPQWEFYSETLQWVVLLEEDEEATLDL